MENKLDMTTIINSEEQNDFPKPDFENNSTGYKYGYYRISYNDGATWIQNGFWWAPISGNFAFPKVGSLLKRTDIIDKNHNIIYSICAKANEKISGFGGGYPLTQEFYINNKDKFERNICLLSKAE